MRDLQNSRIKSALFTPTSPQPSPPLPSPRILAEQRHYQPQMVYVAAPQSVLLPCCQHQSTDLLTATHIHICRTCNLTSLYHQHTHHKLSIIAKLAAPQAGIQGLVKLHRLVAEQVSSLATADMPSALNAQKHDTSSQIGNLPILLTSALNLTPQSLDGTSHAGL